MSDIASAVGVAKGTVYGYVESKEALFVLCLRYAELESEGREALARYLDMCMKAGQLRPVPNVRLAARMIVEVATTWAIHIKWDRSPENFDPDEARENAIDFLVQSLAL